MLWGHIGGHTPTPAELRPRPNQPRRPRADAAGYSRSLRLTVCRDRCSDARVAEADGEGVRVIMVIELLREIEPVRGAR